MVAPADPSYADITRRTRTAATSAVPAASAEAVTTAEATATEAATAEAVAATEAAEAGVAATEAAEASATRVAAAEPTEAVVGTVNGRRLDSRRTDSAADLVPELLPAEPRGTGMPGIPGACGGRHVQRHLGA